MERSRAVDVLKLVMALCVVGIHSNPAADISRTLVALTGDGLFRIAVPTFLVINGYFFEPLPRAGRVGAYLRRILGLYALWMALYLPLWWRFLLSPDGALHTIIFGWWHLWYLSGLVMAAALAALVAHWPTRRLVLLMVLTFAAGVAVQYALAFGLLRTGGPILRDGAWLHRNGLLLCLPFFLAGLLIRRHDVARRWPADLIGAAAIAGPLLVLAEAGALRAWASHGWGLDNLITIGMAAPALVLLALKAPVTRGGALLGTLSTGIYFLHVAIVAPLVQNTDWSHGLIALIGALGSVLITLALVRLGWHRRLF